MPAGSGGFARAELPGGLVVLTEEMPGVRSAALGVWVRTGSVAETRAEMGVSHMLEHMAFKGAGERGPREIALAVERLGGSLDAYTTREHTSYQARVLDSDVDSALEVLSDLVLDPALREEDLELEREVVLEEIAGVEDTPDDQVFELHADALWGDHPYGYSILGTRESVSRFTAADLQRVHAREYRRPRIVMAAAGSVRHGEFVERVAERFAGASSGEESVAVESPRMRKPRELRVERDSAQTHIVTGTGTFGHGDSRRYAMALAAAAFGGGMSSRLFQRVREELGLAYSVHAFQTLYRGAGVTGVYVGTRPEWADEATAVVRRELTRLAEDGLSAEELADAKGQVKGQLTISLESTGARLQRLAGFELYDEPFLTLSDLIARIDAVTLDEVADVAAEFYHADRYVTLRLGPA